MPSIDKLSVKGGSDRLGRSPELRTGWGTLNLVGPVAALSSGEQHHYGTALQLGHTPAEKSKNETMHRCVSIHCLALHPFGGTATKRRARASHPAVSLDLIGTRVQPERPERFERVGRMDDSGAA